MAHNIKKHKKVFTATLLVTMVIGILVAFNLTHAAIVPSGYGTGYMEVSPYTPTFGSVTPGQVYSGSSATLIMNMFGNFTSCSASGFNSSSISITPPAYNNPGSAAVSLPVSPANTTTYSATCTGPGGTQTKSTTLYVPPNPPVNFVYDNLGTSYYLYESAAPINTISSTEQTQTAYPTNFIGMQYGAADDYYCDDLAYKNGLPANKNYYCIQTASNVTYSGNLPTPSGCQMLITSNVCSGQGYTTTWTENIYTVAPTVVSASGAPPSIPGQSEVCASGGVGCSLYTFTATSVPPPSPSASISANPPSITAGTGSNSNLVYSCTNATSASIDNGVGNVNPSGTNSVSVTPGSTTTYTLTCANSGGSQNASATVTVNNFPDLTAGLSSSNDVTATAGVSATYTGSVYNNSSDSTAGTGGPFHDTFWFSTVPNSSGNFAHQDYVSGSPGGFPAGYGEVESVSQTINTPGTYYFQVCADQDASGNGTINEADETNNCSSHWSTITVNASPAPDLTAGLSSANDVNTTIGVNTGITGSVYNIGSSGTGAPFKDTFWYSMNSDMSSPFSYDEFTSGYPGGFPAGYNEVETVHHTFSSPGTVYFRVCANYDHSWNPSVSESNTSNNCSGVETIQVGGLPDLTAGLSAANNVSTAVGVNTGITGSVYNIGSVGTGAPFKDTFWYSANSDMSSPFSYDEFTSGVPGGFPAGYNEVETVHHTFGSSGTFYFRVCANNDHTWTNSVPESDTSNDCSGIQTITVAPPVINSCTVSNSAPDVGTPVTYTATPGTGVAGPYSWSPSDPTMCTASSGTTEDCTFTSPGSYTMQVKGSNTANYTCSLVTSNYPGCTGVAQPTITANGHPTSILVKKGSTAVIAWDGTNGGSCTITGPGVSAATTCSAPTGSASPVITGRSVYTISCQTGSASVIVNLQPIEAET